MPDRFDQFRAGDPFGIVGPRRQWILDGPAATKLNRILAEIRRLGNIDAIPPMTVRSDEAGRHFSLDLPLRIDALLSGSINPYSFTQQTPVAGGGWTPTPNGMTGSFAYEANLLVGLGGKVVRLEYQPVSNDWRFQWQRNVPPCVGQVCVSVTGCRGLPVYDATVDFTDPNGVPLGTLPVTGRLVGVTRTSGGSGYTNGTGYALSFTGGSPTTVATGTFNVVSGVVTGLVLTSGGDGYTSEPVIGFPGAGSGTGASAVSAMLAATCMPMTVAGVYTIVTTGGGYDTQTRTVTAACVTNNSNSGLTVASTHVCVIWCDQPIPKTLFLTDANATIALIWNGTVWGGCYNFSTQVLNSNAWPGCLALSTGNVIVVYSLTVVPPVGTPAGQTRLNALYWAAQCDDGTPINRIRTLANSAATIGACGGIAHVPLGTEGSLSQTAIKNASPTSCGPFSITFSGMITTSPAGWPVPSTNATVTA